MAAKNCDQGEERLHRENRPSNFTALANYLVAVIVFAVSMNRSCDRSHHFFAKFTNETLLITRSLDLVYEVRLIFEAIN